MPWPSATANIAFCTLCIALPPKAPGRAEAGNAARILAIKNQELACRSRHQAFDACQIFNIAHTVRTDMVSSATLRTAATPHQSKPKPRVRIPRRVVSNTAISVSGLCNMMCAPVLPAKSPQQPFHALYRRRPRWRSRRSVHSIREYAQPCAWSWSYHWFR